MDFTSKTKKKRLKCLTSNHHRVFPSFLVDPDTRYLDPRAWGSLRGSQRTPGTPWSRASAPTPDRLLPQRRPRPQPVHQSPADCQLPPWHAHSRTLGGDVRHPAQGPQDQSPADNAQIWKVCLLYSGGTDEAVITWSLSIETFQCHYGVFFERNCLNYFSKLNKLTPNSHHKLRPNS